MTTVRRWRHDHPDGDLRVKDGRADENAAYVRDVMADSRTPDRGVTYSVYLLDDGVTFLHVADGGEGSRKVQVSEAFQRFTATLLEEPVRKLPSSTR